MAVLVDRYLQLIVPEHNSAGQIIVPPVVGHVACVEAMERATGTFVGGTINGAISSIEMPDIVLVQSGVFTFGSLLHFNGTNGSTAFIDVNNPVFTWSVNPGGTAHLDSTRSLFGFATSFNPGTSGIVTNQASNPVWITGSANFTWECWGYLTGIGSSDTFHLLSDNNNIGSQFEFLRVGSPGQPRFITFAATYNGSASPAFSLVGSTVVTLNSWHHFAVVRNGTTVTLFLDGIADAVATGVTGTLGVGPGIPTMTIGSDLVAAFPWIGNMADVRATLLVKYTSNFTPTGPLTLP